MTLPLRERLILLAAPSALYYAYRIRDEAVSGEHELDVLHRIVAPGGIAVDVGANQGFFAFALHKTGNWVEAFEPNPDYARFAQRMLGTRARVHQVALSSTTGTAEFTVPVGKDGMVLHLGGKLDQGRDEGYTLQRYPVEVRTLDSYGFDTVRVIKIDVEGNELAVLEGGRATIAKFRPPLIVELLTGAFDDPATVTEIIAHTYDYKPLLVTKDGVMVDALPVIKGLGTNTTWGSPIRNRNVLFLPNT